MLFLDLSSACVRASLGLLEPLRAVVTSSGKAVSSTEIFYSVGNLLLSGPQTEVL